MQEMYNCLQGKVGAVYCERNQISPHPMNIHYRDENFTTKHLNLVDETDDGTEMIAKTTDVIATKAATPVVQPSDGTLCDSRSSHIETN